MKRYLLYSCASHGAFVGFILFMGLFFSRPSSTNYSIDLMTSLPSGSIGGPSAAPEMAEEKAPVAPAPVVHEAPKAVPHDALKIFDKNKKKTPVVSKKKPVAAPPKVNAKSAARALAIANGVGLGHAPAGANDNAGDGSGNGGGGIGVGVMAEGGVAFPYPWYLKAIAQKLDQHWKPPQEFQSDTVSVVSFVIHRDGDVSDSTVEQASGDSMFDQLALRAVLYSNPLPPLPTGFPDETLRVHMKFVGKHG